MQCGQRAFRLDSMKDWHSILSVTVWIYNTPVHQSCHKLISVVEMPSLEARFELCSVDVISSSSNGRSFCTCGVDGCMETVHHQCKAYLLHTTTSMLLWWSTSAGSKDVSYNNVVDIKYQKHFSMNDDRRDVGILTQALLLHLLSWMACDLFII